MIIRLFLVGKNIRFVFNNINPIQNSIIFSNHLLKKERIMGSESAAIIAIRNNRKLQKSIKGFEKQKYKIKHRKIRTFKTVSPEHKAAYIQKIKRQGFYNKLSLACLAVLIICFTIWIVSLL